MQIWLDLTGVFNSCSIDIIKNQYELAIALYDSNPALRFCRSVGSNFVELSVQSLEQLQHVENTKPIPIEQKADTMPQQLQQAYAYSDSRRERLERAGGLIANQYPQLLKNFLKIIWKILFSPIKFVFFLKRSIQKNKQAYYQKPSQLENQVKFTSEDKILIISELDTASQNAYSHCGATLIYYMMDAAPLGKENELFFKEDTLNVFQEMFEWAIMNCAALLYASESIRDQALLYQKETGIHAQENQVVHMGVNDSVISPDACKSDLLERYSIKRPFILAVGDISMINNYDTLYKAFAILGEQYSDDEMPNLVIAGNFMYTDEENVLLDNILRDPRVCDHILVITPNVKELHSLYLNCIFFISASLNESANQYFAQAAFYKKSGVLADIKHVRELYGDLAEYIDPFDPMAWAEKIKQWLADMPPLSRSVGDQYKSISWSTCAQGILAAANETKSQAQAQGPSLFFDLTMSFKICLYGGSRVHGIPRAELMLAREINRVYPAVRYVALISGVCIDISKTDLRYILGSNHIDDALVKTRDLFGRVLENAQQGVQGNAERRQAFWLFCSILPSKIQKLVIGFGENIENKNLKNKELKGVFPFKRGDIVFSASGNMHDAETDLLLNKEKEKIGFAWSQIIYDLTTVLYPQTHMLSTIKNYGGLLDFTFAVSDLIFYGGQTCMNDSLNYLQGKNMPHHIAVPIQFGNDIPKPLTVSAADDAVLESMGICSSYILSVGTIQPRKNHETLYKAYLRMLESGMADIPQLVFVGGGHSGWKSQDLLYTMARDERIQNKILILSPSDEELDVLYRNCMFTVLPSQYEGWSLTLPESFGYGKFCLASDVSPLKEAGRDLAEYIHPFDTVKWAERIMYYVSHEKELKEREDKITAEWNSTTWRECAEHIFMSINKYFMSQPDTDILQ